MISSNRPKPNIGNHPQANLLTARIVVARSLCRWRNVCISKLFQSEFASVSKPNIAVACFEKKVLRKKEKKKKKKRKKKEKKMLPVLI